MSVRRACGGLSGASQAALRAHPDAVLSYDYWSRRVGRDPKAVGRILSIGNDAYEIVGVAEQGFTGTETGRLTGIFIPAMMNAEDIDNANFSWFRTWVHLRPGASRDQERQKLQAIVGRSVCRCGPRALHLTSAPSSSRTPLLSSIRPPPACRACRGLTGRSMVILAVLVALVLLIACANLANLLTAQAAQEREMSSVRAGEAHPGAAIVNEAFAPFEVMQGLDRRVTATIVG